MKTKKYTTKLCNDNMSYEDCELAILHHAIDETKNIKGKKQVNNEDVQKMLQIVEKFIIKKKLICYGGTAINNILPKYAQFYQKDIEIPDYDFFSSSALDDAKELANIYYNQGYKDVEAKAGVHKGTFKVFVNYIPIADITSLHIDLYKNLLTDSIKIAGIHYCPPNFLRMGMYLELSRPEGDVSRWEKVYKRLNLLNTHYPMKENCKSNQNKIDTKLQTLLCNTLINHDAIFFGGYAYNLYNKFYNKKIIDNNSFDILTDDINKMALIIEEQLEQNNYKKFKKILHNPVGELIPEHIEFQIDKQSILYIYKPIACHNYNIVKVDDKEIKIATIDTILAFYLAFIYNKDKTRFDKNRLLCMSKFLFDLSEKHKTETKGILKRFSINCFGTQPTLETIRSNKANKFKELKHDKTSEEYEQWFLNYSPYKLNDKTIINKNSILNEDKMIIEKISKTDSKINSDSKIKSKTLSIKKKLSLNTTKKNKKINIFKKILNIQ